jgi:hypothetical protein
MQVKKWSLVLFIISAGCGGTGDEKTREQDNVCVEVFNDHRARVRECDPETTARPIDCSLPLPGFDELACECSEADEQYALCFADCHEGASCELLLLNDATDEQRILLQCIGDCRA